MTLAASSEAKGRSGARRLALVTGASSGIGEAFARAYAARGLDVALTARRTDRLQALADELSAAHGVEAIPIPADLSVFEAHAGVLGALAQRGRVVDVLVNNAGFGVAQSFTGVPWERQRDFLMIMVVNACGLAYDVIPGMVERGAGSIINVASLAGFSPGVAGHTLYPGAKSLSIKFSQALADEYGAKGLKITAVCPGSTSSEFAQTAGIQQIMDQAQRGFLQSAAEVARAAIAGNERGRVIVVPGWYNKLAAGLLQYLPQPLVRAIIRAGSAKYHLGD